MEESAGRKARPRRATAAQMALDLRGGVDIPPVDWDEHTEPLTLLPAQWRAPRQLCECGCQRLALEVLLAAFRELHAPPAGRPDLFARTQREARDWFMHPDAAVQVNLADCCATLGLDVRAVQRRTLPVVRGHPSKLRVPSTRLPREKLSHTG